MGKMKRWSTVVLASLGSVVFDSCTISFVDGLFSGCFGEDSISSSEYDDLNVFEQILYHENDCGRYEPRSGTLDHLF